MILKQSRKLAVLNQIELILLTPKAVQKIKTDLILNHLAIMAQIAVLPGSRGLNQMIMPIPIQLRSLIQVNRQILLHLQVFQSNQI
jgi:hypothetical protein